MGSGGDCGCGCKGTGSCAKPGDGRFSGPAGDAGPRATSYVTPAENRQPSSAMSPPAHPWVVGSGGVTPSAGRRGSCDDSTIVPPMSRRPWRTCEELPGIPLDATLEPPLGDAPPAPRKPPGASPGPRIAPPPGASGGSGAPTRAAAATFAEIDDPGGRASVNSTDEVVRTDGPEVKEVARFDTYRGKPSPVGGDWKLVCVCQPLFTSDQTRFEDWLERNPGLEVNPRPWLPPPEYSVPMAAPGSVHGELAGTPPAGLPMLPRLGSVVQSVAEGSAVALASFFSPGRIEQ